jgi:hypothetical protein
LDEVLMRVFPGECVGEFHRAVASYNSSGAFRSSNAT